MIINQIPKTPTRKGKKGKVFDFSLKISRDHLMNEMNRRRAKALKLPLEPEPT
jgi:hypothetical protein